MAIHEAGAAVVGIDHRLNQASPAQLGGAASDALFLETLRTASPVVLIHDAAIYGRSRVIPIMWRAAFRPLPGSDANRSSIWFDPVRRLSPTNRRAHTDSFVQL